MGLKKKVAAGIATGVMSVAMASPALAVVTYVEGGTWDHGENNSIVWSYYYHPNNNHKSSVKTNQVYPSGCTSPGYYSYASAASRFWSVDYSYYGFC
ncbi:hypothetical protein Daura_00685 [Dactylosporangium aurantiacum]|uniref:Lactococcin 972 family bacteriocin n=1 Tax=Dactylosporangium aurantiacum TaxID=35754 RepID=A0A9Q9IG22_9ACTN|nr:lactococcin 972 family bacteriocin [Dactylosporangium aurantiacum]MDG6101119.1 lactococcin 972 family bacteriocin [Dactylosporangium aurantiacum]UWZ54846.1 hypothetical protein Daura_00685 [Dactylosporangium aurantiacum]